MPTKKTLSPADITSKQSFLNQLVDIIQEDVSGSATRKTYSNFITGTLVGPGVTSSLFQSVYDQDYSLQTANAIFDMTFGLRSGSNLVASASTGEDSAGKLLFSSQSLMMREKVANYSQYAQLLLGDATNTFYAPFASTTATEKIDEALFINFRRLFSRDQIRRETFALRFYQTGVLDGSANDSAVNIAIANGLTGTNINRTTTSGSTIFTDVGSAANQLHSFGGAVGNIVDSSDTTRKVGLMFYDMGIGVFDLSRICMTDQHISGVIDAVGNANDAGAGAGKMILGSATGNPSATFKPDLLVSASIDGVLNHIASTRFSSGSITAATFQNQTEINSTLIFCRTGVNDFNYSSNPTFTDANGQIVVLTPNTNEKTFSFITTIGLYDASDRLLAVAKLSRPVEKNDTRDLTFRVRLDF